VTPWKNALDVKVASWKSGGPAKLAIKKLALSEKVEDQKSTEALGCDRPSVARGMINQGLHP
jgi:hypothetical protein